MSSRTFRRGRWSPLRVLEMGCLISSLAVVKLGTTSEFLQPEMSRSPSQSRVEADEDSEVKKPPRTGTVTPEASPVWQPGCQPDIRLGFAQDIFSPFLCRSQSCPGPFCFRPRAHPWSLRGISAWGPSPGGVFLFCFVCMTSFRILWAFVLFCFVFLSL